MQVLVINADEDISVLTHTYSNLAKMIVDMIPEESQKDWRRAAIRNKIDKNMLNLHTFRFSKCSKRC